MTKQDLIDVIEEFKQLKEESEFCRDNSHLYEKFTDEDYAYYIGMNVAYAVVIFRLNCLKDK